jgi:Ca2+-binding EF-hand superfamily protein
MFAELTISLNLRTHPQFDMDGNGQISKKELLLGCRSLNIQVSSEELDLMWPMFDTNGDGNLDVQEFMDFVAETSKDSSSYKMSRGLMDRQMHAMTNEQRKERIRRKSILATKVTEFSSELRESVCQHMQENQLSAEELFLRFDDDGNGEVDKNEFLAALSLVGIPCTPTQMNVLWPLFNREEQGKIGLDQWSAFLSEQPWTYEFVIDAFSSKVAQDELDKFMKTFEVENARAPPPGKKGSQERKQSMQMKLPPMITAHDTSVAVRKPGRKSSALGKPSSLGSVSENSPLASAGNALAQSSVTSPTNTPAAPLSVAERRRRSRLLSTTSIPTLAALPGGGTNRRGSAKPGLGGGRNSVGAIEALATKGRKASMQLTAEIAELRQRHTTVPNGPQKNLVAKQLVAKSDVSSTKPPRVRKWHVPDQ